MRVRLELYAISMSVNGCRRQSNYIVLLPIDFSFDVSRCSSSMTLHSSSMFEYGPLSFRSADLAAFSLSLYKSKYLWTIKRTLACSAFSVLSVFSVLCLISLTHRGLSGQKGKTISWKTANTAINPSRIGHPDSVPSTDGNPKTWNTTQHGFINKLQRMQCTKSVYKRSNR